MIAIMWRPVTIEQASKRDRKRQAAARPSCPLLGYLDIAAAAFLSLSVRGALGLVIAASALSVATEDGLILIAFTACSIAAWAAAAWSEVCADADCTRIAVAAAAINRCLIGTTIRNTARIPERSRWLADWR
jgi:hypothetical protein